MHRPLATLFLLAAATRALPAQTMGDYARCLRGAGDAPARAAFEQQAQRAPGTAAGEFAAGCVDFARQQWESAAAHFERASNAAPTSSAAFTMWGNALGSWLPSASMFSKVKHGGTVRTAFERAVAIDGTNLDARNGLLQFYLQAPGIVGGDKRKARDQADAIAKVDPWRGFSARLTVARAMRDTALVTRTLVDATTTWPDSAAPWLALVAAQADARNAGAAFATVDRWTKARPGTPAINYAIGRVAAVTGQQLDRGESALRAYLAAARRPGDPGVAVAQHRLGQVLEAAGKPAEAKVAYQAAIGADPAYKPAREALARLD
ncbi:MAG: hypothetical protein MUF21_06530 [Gemmatimonadaceae bacterium]|nr:hypothetical protein [Gemmatimonadaceae bacterium]